MIHIRKKKLDGETKNSFSSGDKSGNKGGGKKDKLKILREKFWWPF